MPDLAKSQFEVLRELRDFKYPEKGPWYNDVFQANGTVALKKIKAFLEANAKVKSFRDLAEKVKTNGLVNLKGVVTIPVQSDSSPTQSDSSPAQSDSGPAPTPGNQPEKKPLASETVPKHDVKYSAKKATVSTAGKAPRSTLISALKKLCAYKAVRAE